MNLQDCCLVMDDEAFLCCWSHKESWSPTFLCRVVKGLNFVWVFSRPKQPEGEGKKKRDCRRFSDLARVHWIQDAPSPVKPLLNQGYCPCCGE